MHTWLSFLKSALFKFNHLTSKLINSFLYFFVLLLASPVATRILIASKHIMTLFTGLQSAQLRTFWFVDSEFQVN